MIVDEIRERLLSLRDEKYRDFQSALIPTVQKSSFIGVRTPDLKRLAKEFSSRAEIGEFLSSLPHATFDENQLHAFLISDFKDFSRCVGEVDRFLPYVNNWATSDQMSPAVFKKHSAELLPFIQKWLSSSEVYAVRFAVKMLMDHFLDKAFDPIYLSWVADTKSEEYYIQMMCAWYFATALAKRYEDALPYLSNGRLSPVVKKKAIRKALESFRVSAEQKAYLRTL